MASNKTTSRKIGAVDTTCSLIEEIRKRNGAGVTELADALGLSKSTVHHHLATLENQNFVRKVDGQYRIGLLFLNYGGHARENEKLFTAWKDDVDRLAEETGETVRLVVENSGYGQTLYQQFGENVTEDLIHVGKMEYLHATAAGKAFLAALPEPEVKTIISEHGLPEITENTITDWETLKDEIDQIRSSGISFDDEEQLEGIRCVASTLNTDDGELLGALSVSAPIKQMPEERFRNDLPQMLLNVADKVELVNNYGFRHSVPCIDRTLPK